MSDDTAHSAVAARRPSPRVIAGVFAGVFAALAIGYFLFLRTDYVPVFTQLRAGDASAIVAQLDSKEIGYRLADGGTSILVAEDQADDARLAIAGSDVALKGGVGFELFNKSDMGLTDFAQRINYQRALQGELERSIMMIAEVESARVHLAMPERTIFRADRRNAKAAVEVVVKPGRTFDAARVAGVQQLVGFAVPDLSPGDVVVLDGSGRVLSSPAQDDGNLSPDAEEQRSVQGYYRARARAALQQALPGATTDVTVAVLGDAPATWPAVPEAAATDVAAPASPARNFRLRVIVGTPAPLNGDDAAAARDAVVGALALDQAAGDELTFRVGAGAPGMSPPIAVAAPREAPVAMPEPAVVAAQGDLPLILIGVATLLALGGAAFALRRHRAGRLSEDERAAMVARLRAALVADDAARPVA